MQITTNYSFIGFKGTQNLKKQEKVTTPNFKANPVTDNIATKLFVGGGLVAAGVQQVKKFISAQEHDKRATQAKEKLESLGFQGNYGEVYQYKLEDLSYMTGEHFDEIIDDIIEMHKEAENGQPVTKEFVDSKLQAIKSKYKLPENAKNKNGYEYNVMSQIRYTFIDDWKYKADYQLSIGIPKNEISAIDMRKKAQPDEEVLARFDDLLTRVGEPIKIERPGTDNEHRVYHNKYGQTIDVYIRGTFSAEEVLNLDEPGVRHYIKKAYYLSEKGFDYYADETNGAYCGKRGEGMSGIEEYTKNGDDSETVEYDEWGIKKSQINKEIKDNVKTEHTIIYAGDGSVITDNTKIEYLR